MGGTSGQILAGGGTSCFLPRVGASLVRGRGSAPGRSLRWEPGTPRSASRAAAVSYLPSYLSWEACTFPLDSSPLLVCPCLSQA